VARSCTCQLADQALAWHQRGLCLDRLLRAAQAETCQACNAVFIPFEDICIISSAKLSITAITAHITIQDSDPSFGNSVVIWEMIRLICCISCPNQSVVRDTIGQ